MRTPRTAALWLALAAGIAGAADWREGFETAAPGTTLSGGAAVVAEAVAAEGKRAAKLARPAGDLKAAKAAAFALPATLDKAEVLWFDGRVRLEKGSAGVTVRLADSAGEGPVFGLAAGQYRGWGGLDEVNPFAEHIVPERFRLALDAGKLGGWIRLSARWDRKTRRFDVWADGKPVLTGFRHAGEGTPTLRDGLRVSFGPAEEPSILAPEAATWIDDLRVGDTRPDGLADAEFPEGKGRKLRFAVIGDPQLGFGGFEESVAAFRQGIHEVNASGADFTLIAGDLVHETTKPLVDQRFEAYVEIARDFRKPTYTVPGNHDPEPEYKKYIRPDLDYTFEAGGIRFIGFQDSSVEKRGGLVPAERIKWLRDRLAEARKAGEPVFLWTHIPPFGPTFDRDVVGPGRDELLVLYREFKPLMTAAGHLHRGTNIYTRGDEVCVVAPGLGRDFTGCNGWLLFDVYADRIEMVVKPLWRPYVERRRIGWPAPIQLPLKR
jgi:Icc-related predicted phosphoesterase